MTDDLVARLQRYLDSFPKPDGRTFHPMHVETLLAEAKDRIEKLEALLEQRDAFIVSKDLWFEFVDSAALAGEKKDDNP